MTVVYYVGWKSASCARSVVFYVYFVVDAGIVTYVCLEKEGVQALLSLEKWRVFFFSCLIALLVSFLSDVSCELSLSLCCLHPLVRACERVAL